jgi:hypothetical protein
MKKEETFQEVLDEMLDLAGVPLTEQDEEEKPAEAEAEAEKEEAPEEGGEEEKKDEEPEEELKDEWEKDFRTGSKFKIQIHENYIYVWYRNKRSAKLQVPPKLRPYRDLFSELMEKILAHVEKVS